MLLRKIFFAVFSIFWFLNPQNSFCLKIDRVILSSDDNPMYLDFWPMVANAWTQLTGFKPTLALIAGKDVVVDESVGDVIRFEPIPGISKGLQAQIIRLLAPCLFENEVSLVSDIDMLPLQREYFVGSIANIPDNVFVVFRNEAYSPNDKRFPMCYNAAKGSVFKEVFEINTPTDIPLKIKAWNSLGLGWDTDEKVLYSSLVNWKHYQSQCKKLNHNVIKRVDRSDWKYDAELARQGYYVDSHLLRPYKAHQDRIDALRALINDQNKTSALPHLLIKIPTRSRPKRLFEVLDKFYAMLSGEIPYTFIISCDEDDATMNNAEVIQKLYQYQNLYFYFGKSTSKIDAYNRDINTCPNFDILIVASDDLEPIEPAFDLVILEEMLNRFPDFDGVLRFSDGLNYSKANIYPIIGKKFYNRFGYIYYPEYISIYCDNELTDVAEQLHKNHAIDIQLMKHNHPIGRSGLWDELYEKNDKSTDKDRVLYEKRKANNFGLTKS